MKIACIGWGSLIWDPRDLLIDKNWHQDGPVLPIEFLRKSNDGRLTLVICEGFQLVPTLWCMMTTDDLDTAIDSLRGREGCRRASIGFVEKAAEPAQGSINNIIESWLQNHDLDAVIWTDLGPKFNDTDGRIPTLDEALVYLANLPESRKKLAENYIRRAPATVATNYRSAFEKTFGWLPIYD